MKRNTKNEKKILLEPEVLENEQLDLGILDYSFTLKDILVFLTPIVVLGGISYYLYVANKKLTFKINKLEAQVTHLVDHYQHHQAVITTATESKAWIHPDTVKVIIDNLPMIIISIGTCVVVYHFLPKSLTLKALLPTSMAEVLGDYRIPGFVEKTVIKHTDNSNNLEYLFTITNNKTISPVVRKNDTLDSAGDWTNLYEYINDLLQKLSVESNLLASTCHSNETISNVADITTSIASQLGT